MIPESAASGIALANALVTAMLVGLTWTIERVHYPLFAEVGPESFPGYHASHTSRMGTIAAPLMIAEAMLALLVVMRPSATTSPLIAWSGLALVGLVWLVTFAWAVPLHGRLSAGFDEGLHRSLCLSHLVRSLLWTSRGVVAAIPLWRTI